MSMLDCLLPLFPHLWSRFPFFSLCLAPSQDRVCLGFFALRAISFSKTLATVHFTSTSRPIQIHVQSISPACLCLSLQHIHPALHPSYPSHYSSHVHSWRPPADPFIHQVPCPNPGPGPGPKHDLLTRNPILFSHQNLL